MATQVALWFIILSTIVGEIYKPFKESLAGLTGHHWTSKSLISIILFVVIIVLLPKEKINVSSAADSISKSIVSGVVLLSLFYTLHSFGIL